MAPPPADSRLGDVAGRGADVEDSEHPELIAQFGILPRDYYLIVSRLIPENSLIEMLEGFRASRTTRRLVVVGSANYEDDFHRQLRQIAGSDSRISMVGHVRDLLAAERRNRRGACDQGV